MRHGGLPEWGADDMTREPSQEGHRSESQVVGQTNIHVSVWFIGPESIRTVGTDNALAPSVAFTFTGRPAVIFSIL